ncbi:hypothetical protein DCAR_0310647 [Daucus carota subsp. sativus]|uniref:Uncharacterized protein n=1 Tax=Daucus carota subsp. sativus TaxID=79200 RepID=A0AAF0WN01_DAUCS|nr:PREDICTED: caffeic acid 3-O-methyltransferase-like [Daucus carota subsp. sativus]WOG91398.1 hypothetical protein DCAR_0310647 [Daucus carota subsp. sativus]
MSKEEEGSDFARALQLSSGTILGMVTTAATQLDLFEIIAKASTANGTSPFGHDAKRLSADDIVAHLPTRNPTAPAMLERILRFLAAKSILNRIVVTGENGEEKSLYGLTSVCKYYVSDEDGVSLAPTLVMLHDKVMVDSWHHLKDAVLEGVTPFNMAHDDMHLFEYPAVDSRFNDVFNQGMYNHTTLVMKKVLEVYSGFEKLTEVVDVGGGTGAMLAKIISKYPQIRGINFDLPHVIKTAAPLHGVEHLGGDMFERVPKGETIFLKAILHDWDDEHCLKLLKNCYNALPEYGKVIIVELVVPEFKSIGSSSKMNYVMDRDILMLAACPGGKERSFKEFQTLAKESGFATAKIICNAGVHNVLEFLKKL